MKKVEVLMMIKEQKEALEAQQRKLDELENNVAEKMDIPKVNGEYWTVTSSGLIAKRVNTCEEVDIQRAEIGNMFVNKDNAEKARIAIVEALKNLED